MTTQKKRSKRRRMPLWLVVSIDVLLIGATLIVYALFHHVLPMRAAGKNAPAINTVTVTPAPTPTAPPQPAEDEPVPTEEPRELSWAEKFAEHFTPEVVHTENSYTSPHVSITVQEYKEQRSGSAQRWYVADIYISDIRCLQTYMPGGTYNAQSAWMPALCQEAGALVAMSGDYNAMAAGGVVIRNGVLCRNDWYDAQIAVLYESGELVCCEPADFDAEAAMAQGAWQAWTFGPALLDENGQARSDFGGFAENVVAYGHPRAAIGYYEPGHYCLVVVDGRQPPEANGMTMADFAALLEEMGCAAAYNLDGGQTAQMCFDGAHYNTPVEGGRYVNDIVLIKDIFAEVEE